MDESVYNMSETANFEPQSLYNSLSSDPDDYLQFQKPESSKNDELIDQKIRQIWENLKIFFW